MQQPLPTVAVTVRDPDAELRCQHRIPMEVHCRECTRLAQRPHGHNSNHGYPEELCARNTDHFAECDCTMGKEARAVIARTPADPDAPVVFARCRVAAVAVRKAAAYDGFTGVALLPDGDLLITQDNDSSPPARLQRCVA